MSSRLRVPNVLLLVALPLACSAETTTVRPSESAPEAAAPEKEQSPEGGEDKYVPEPEPDPLVKGPFDLDDVSILFPLPPTDQLLTASTKTAHGELLPQALFASFPTLGSHGQPKGISYDALRVVALRIDPCFPSLSLPQAQCRAQIRLSMQPVSYHSGRVFDGDQAVHLLYDVPPADLDTFAAQLSNLRSSSGVSTTGAPLGVHPALKREGVDGPFGRGLRAALLSKIGAARLTRVAMMGLPQHQAEWKFFGFDIQAGKPTAIDIASAGFAEQSVHVTFGPDGMAGLNPAAASDGDFTAFFNVMPDAPPPTAAALEDAESVTLRIENPNLRDVESVSCGACHLAGPLRKRAEKRWGISAAGNTNAFTTTSFDLRMTSDVVGDARAVRAFGYREGKAVISQRTINESAAVAGYLNARQP